MENHIKEPQNSAHPFGFSEKTLLRFSTESIFIRQRWALALGLWLGNKRGLFGPWAGMFAHRS